MNGRYGTHHQRVRLEWHDLLLLISVGYFQKCCRLGRETGCQYLVVSIRDRYAQQCYYHTAFLKLTPHHSTGARFVAQSKVKRLMIHMMTSTGMGANSTSVRLRKGRATAIVSIPIGNDALSIRTVISQKCNNKVVRQSEQVHCVAEEVADPVVLSDQGHEQELEDVEEGPDRQERSDRNLALLSAWN